jgi:type II secretory pathway pseudopilin PulG
MKKTSKTKGFSSIEGFLILVIILILAGVGYYVWHSTKNTNDILNTAEKSNNASSNKAQKMITLDVYKDWKTYIWTSQGVSFKYPNNWFIKEDSSLNRVYASSVEADVTKDNMPANFQRIWFSTESVEASLQQEEGIKSGSSSNRQVSGPVAISTIKSGSITIDTYEYETVGGPTLQAFWEDSANKRFYATNSTEVGEKNQKDMVANLKKILATVSFVK